MSLSEAEIASRLAEARARLDLVRKAIDGLESLNGFCGIIVRPKSRRGRKSMGAAERTEVSERMKKYWASRRNRPPESET
jgi:hypothetical protein